MKQYHLIRCYFKKPHENLLIVSSYNYNNYYIEDIIKTYSPYFFATHTLMQKTSWIIDDIITSSTSIEEVRERAMLEIL